MAGAPDMNFHSLVDVISSQFVSCSQEGILGDGGTRYELPQPG